MCTIFQNIFTFSFQIIIKCKACNITFEKGSDAKNHTCQIKNPPDAIISNPNPPIIENMIEDVVIPKNEMGEEEEEKTVVNNPTTPVWPKCDLCSEYFKSEINFKMHMAKVHSNPNVDSTLGHKEVVQVFQCFYCNDVFKTETSRDLHMGIVHMTDLTNSKTMQLPSSTVSQNHQKSVIFESSP